MKKQIVNQLNLFIAKGLTPHPYWSCSIHERINHKNWLVWSYSEALKTGYHKIIYSLLFATSDNGKTCGIYCDISKNDIRKHSIN